jgi:hypothetical protein
MTETMIWTITGTVRGNRANTPRRVLLAGLPAPGGED